MTQVVLHDVDRYYRCARKTAYMCIIPATRAAYYLSEFRGREYEPYRCPYCQEYHIGRVNRVRRPVTLQRRSKYMWWK